ITGAMIFLMQAGFALLESGLTRAKNSVNVIMKNYADLCVGVLTFGLIGFGLMFGNNPSGWVGSSMFGLVDLSNYDYAFIFFQAMFAATAATITSGAMAERTKFPGYLLGTLGITLFIYPIFGSWVWGGYGGGSGWLAEAGFIDFAGSTVVHSVGGWCALAAIMVLGPRLGRYGDMDEVHDIPGHNLNYMALGGFILWFGWFGFNAGSTTEVNDSLGLISLNTALSASASVLSVVILSQIISKRVLSKDVVNGSIAGLVAVTAGCATMEPLFALFTGLIGGIVMLLGERIVIFMRLDDVVGAVAAHGFAGAWGTIAAGMFLAGDLFNTEQITVQLIGVVMCFIWVFPTAFIMYKLIDLTIGLRASFDDERQGLDYTEHNELGYPEFQKQTLNKFRRG
ncbi:MAG: ammonium transporter, partial [Pseudomonadota bacterium]|nr:ammonium transporter [Pseudomonadota bacterium]